jgi:hypothetical protein
VEYNDEQPITIQVNEPSRGDLGFGLLENFCTVFNPETSTFTATKISAFGREDVSNQETATLQDEETHRFQWEFPLREEDISELGAGCSPSFSLTYTHTVNGSKQVQVRENEQVPPVQNLETGLKSPTPVKPRIETNDVFTVGDPIYTQVYLENTGRGTLTHVQNVNASLTPGGGQSRINEEECGLVNPGNRNTNIFVISTGPRSGQTSRLECGPDTGFKVSADDLSGRSNTFQVTMTGTYTYQQDVDNVPVKVAPSE